jgi:hypothetical protein
VIIVESTLDHRLLSEALVRAPATEVTWERTDIVDGEYAEVLLRARGDDFAAFERGIEADPTVTAPTQLVALGDHRLYSVGIDGAFEESVYPVLVEVGGVVRSATATHEGWTCRIAFPDQAAIDRFFEFCRDHGIASTVHGVYQERDSLDALESTGVGAGVTAAQREALRVAFERGYFEVPRECTLGDLADALGVSDAAVSKRLRRGLRATLAETLVQTVPAK